MSDTNRQNRNATLVAVWPGMGQVALAAGYYLMSRLKMEEIDPVPADDLFDVQDVDVKDGLLRRVGAPRGRLYLWKNPDLKGDVIVFMGEAQPQSGRNVAFCSRLLDTAAALGVREVYTFAAMASDMLPSNPSRVLAVATDVDRLSTLKHLDMPLLQGGRISGMNGVFLALAAERGLPGTGLLGEIPAMAAQIPYPKAARKVLEAFSLLSGIEIDLTELVEHEKRVDEELTAVITQIEATMKAQRTAARETEGDQDSSQEPEFESEPEPEAGPSDTDRARIEALFKQARKDHAKSFELKQELDRLGVFKEYEDRFLDLFRQAG